MLRFYAFLLLPAFWALPATAQEQKSVYQTPDGTICGVLLNSEFGRKVLVAKTTGKTHMLWAEPPKRPHTYVLWDESGKIQILRHSPEMKAKEIEETALAAKAVLTDILDGTGEKREGVRKCTLLELEELS